MRIINRKDFLKMPAGTLFTKYKPCVFGDMMIKGESLSNDFFCQQIVDAVDCDNSEEFNDILLDAGENGTDFSMDFDCEMRDGMFDDGELFAVWGEDDVQALVDRLKETITDVVVCKNCLYVQEGS